jgi:putative acetyltransferase
MSIRADISVRPLAAADVQAMLAIIGDARREYGLEHRVREVLEPADLAILATYSRPRSAYFVATEAGTILGGAGIARVDSLDASVCELQRMYLRPEGRGRGAGQALLTRCFEAARELGFRTCYAETIAEMKTAIAFYERNGFRRLNAPLGATNHPHNDCWLLRGVAWEGI